MPSGILQRASGLIRRASILAFAAAACVGCAQQPGTAAAPGPEAAAAAQRAAFATRLLTTSYYEVMHDPALAAYVKETAVAAVQKNCIGCHGPELKGGRGIPNLVDEEWLWGTGSDEDTDETKVIQLEQTLLFGIRNQDCPPSSQKEHYGACPDTRYSSMPAWGKVDLYTPAQIDELTEYTLSLSGQKVDAAAAARGKKNWQPCAECHGPQGRGFAPYGGPDLTDQLWLVTDGSRQAVHDVIYNGTEGGACPPWGRKLDAATINAVAMYVYGRATEAW